jgi:exodeoxyribonuclease VII small subunit
MISRRLLSPAAPDAGASPEKFEDLLARLEQIVSDMETAELPLEKLLSSYEEGMRLVKACGDKLTDAEQKVEILSRSVETAKGAAGATAPASEDAPIETEDDIRLF